MLQYFLRRLLLAIPTFFGCTIVVFFIVQLAPGGPLEQQIMAMKAGSGMESGGGGGASAGSASGQIPKAAIEELTRFYGFDKPVYQRYFIWLGLAPRETESFKTQLGVSRNIGSGNMVVVEKGATGYRIFAENDKSKPLDGWEFEETKDEDGSQKIRIYKSEFSGILTGNFGKSYEYRVPVLKMIVDRMPVSIQFGILDLILVYTVCVYLGIQKALQHGSKFDFVSSALVFVAYSIPGWALGSVLLVLFGGGSFWNIFPLGSLQSRDYESLSFFMKIADRAWHAVLPTIAYTMAGFASLTVLMKNSLLENLSQDYVRTAFAKGLSEHRVVWLHAMRNSIIPISANLGHIISVFLASNYLIEIVFDINGIGKLSFQAIISRDYPIVFGFTVITVIIGLLGSIISDFILATVDPRIRFK